MGIGTKQKIWKRVKSAVQATLMMSVYAMPLMMPVKAQVVGLSNTQFATPTQLKQLSLDGHIVFGYRANEATYLDKNSNEQTAPVGDMEWLVGGQDGDDIVLWGEYPVLGKRQFHNSPGSNEEPGNRYKPSDIRAALVDLQTNSNYFGSTEQNLMATTEIKTMRAGENVTDKLYLPGVDGKGGSYTNIYIGSSDQVSIPASKWKATSWLRSPVSDTYYNALVAHSYFSFVDFELVTNTSPAPVCAFKLDLDNVNFASSATSALSGSSAQSTTQGTLSQITGEPAMRLRTSGLESDTPTVSGSTVTFNAKSGERLMVQLYSCGNTYQCYFAGNGSEQTVNLNTIAENSNVDDALIVGKCWIEEDETGTNGRLLKSTPAQTVSFGAPGNIDRVEKGVQAYVAQQSTDTYNIELSWGDMTFVYDKGYWNGSARVRSTEVAGPENGHTATETGIWYGLDGTKNKVCMTNKSNVKVKAVASVATNSENTHIGDVTMSIAGAANEEWGTEERYVGWDDELDEPIYEEVAKKVTMNASPETSPLNPVSKNLLLNITGTPDNQLSDTYANAEVLGTITISFSKTY